VTADVGTRQNARHDRASHSHDREGVPRDPPAAAAAPETHDLCHGQRLRILRGLTGDLF
jgi:hypothetical protein